MDGMRVDRSRFLSFLFLGTVFFSLALMDERRQFYG